MDLLRAKLQASGQHRLCLGGESSSSSDQLTQQTDRRVSGGHGGAQISGDGNQVSVVAADLGAVAGGIELASTALKASTMQANAFAAANADVATSSLTFASNVYGKAIASQQQVFTQALDGLETAYATAKAGDQRIVSMVGLAVLGLAAVVAIFSGSGKGR